MKASTEDIWTMKEMDISAEDINKIWGTNYKILPQNETKLLGLPEAV
jgi:hypothetical protein